MITAYVKPTNFCNVGCTHCYLPEAVRAHQGRMTPAVLEELKSDARQKKLAAAPNF